MALSSEARDRIERWTGEIRKDDEKRFEDWIDFLGEPEVAALQFLTRKRATMVISPTQVRSGSDAVSHGQNLGAIEDLIGDLVAYILGNLDDLNLTEDGADLVDAAASGSTDQTITVDTVSVAPRRG